MNIAFPALIIFLLLLPGFIFHSFFYTEGNTLLDYQPFSRKTILCFIFNFSLHFLWIFFIWLFGYTINFEVLISLLATQQNSYFHIALEIISLHILSISSYFFSLYIFSGLFAYWAGKLIRKYKLDKTIKFLRIESSWYYFFEGYDCKNKPNAVSVSATIEQGNECYLYEGILVDFFLDNKGEPERLVLASARRRLLEDDKLESDKKNTENNKNRFYSIDSDYFVLKYAELKTLNLVYLNFEPAWVTNERVQLKTHKGKALVFSS